MIASTHHQSWIFFLPLAQQASLLKDDLLDPVDELWDDPERIDLIRPCLATRCPMSTRTGRRGMAPDRLLRCSQSLIWSKQNRAQRPNLGVAGAPDRWG